MDSLSDAQKSELALHGITTREDALKAPGWVVGGEMRAALHGHSFTFVEHEPVGWDIHVGPPGHDNYQGSHVVAVDSQLRWRVCTEKNALRCEEQVEAHGGALLHHPILLHPCNYVLDVRVTNGSGMEKKLMTIWQPHLHDGGTDTFGNQYEIEGQQVTVTSRDGQRVVFLLDGDSIVAVQLTEPDKEISVTVDGVTTQVEVPSHVAVTLASLLAGRTTGTVSVCWDGKTRTLSQRALWNETVVGEKVVVL